jgi:hypothetical protein
MLWAYPASKDLITFITSTYILLCRSRILTSNRSNISGPLESCNSVICISIVTVMVIVKTFDNNQWPLLWFITQDDITRFNIYVIRTHFACIWCWDKPRANLDSHDTPRPGLGRCHHHIPYSIFCDSPRHLHSNVTFSRDSRNGVLKLSRMCPGWTLGTLDSHNSSPQPRIGTRFEPIL